MTREGGKILAISPNASEPLQPGLVFIWRVSLSVQADAVVHLQGLLNTEELERSDRFRSAVDRARYIVSRGALRTILGRLLKVRPEELAFEHGPQGKPFLATQANKDRLQFNLSHCIDTALIAVTSSGQVGIDVESIQPIPELERIVEQYFNSEERRFIGPTECDEAVSAFLRIWTRREAAAKAIGLDLSAALSDLDIPVSPTGQRIRLDHLTNDPRDSECGPRAVDRAGP